jgi:hypothetical protein
MIYNITTELNENTFEHGTVESKNIDGFVSAENEIIVNLNFVAIEMPEKIVEEIQNIVRKYAI